MQSLNSEKVNLILEEVAQLKSTQNSQSAAE
jgi:hypothetical protein